MRTCTPRFSISARAGLSPARLRLPALLPALLPTPRSTFLQPLLPALLGASLLLAGCASAPKEQFYTLNAVPPAEAAPAATAAPMTISLTALTLPDLYDRPQFVVREDANRVGIKEEHRWAQSLRLEIARVLTADLAARLPAASFLTTDARPVATPDYRIGVNIEQFDAMPGQAVMVQASWSIRGSGSNAATVINGRSTVREAAAGPGYDALAAAYGRALGTMSTEIANRLARMQKPSR